MFRLIGFALVGLAALAARPEPVAAQQKCITGNPCQVPPVPCSPGNKSCIILGPGTLRPGEPPTVTPAFPPRLALPRNTVPDRTSRIGIRGPTIIGGFVPVPVYGGYPYGAPYPVIESPSVTVNIYPPMPPDMYEPPQAQIPAEMVPPKSVIDSIVAYTAQQYTSIVDSASATDRRVIHRVIDDLCGQVLYADCVIRFWTSAKDAPVEGAPTPEQVRKQVAEFRLDGKTGARTFYFMKDGKPITP